MSLDFFKILLEAGPICTRKIRPYWEEREDTTVFNTPVRGSEWFRNYETGGWEFKGTPVLSEEEQEWILSVFKAVFGQDVRVEVMCDGKDAIKFKMRNVFNPGKEKASEDLTAYLLELRDVRKRLNKLGKKFKRCKVFYLVYESESKMTSLNVVFNKYWRRYENYEILFRNKTQARRVM